MTEPSPIPSEAVWVVVGLGEWTHDHALHADNSLPHSSLCLSFCGQAETGLPSLQTRCTPACLCTALHVPPYLPPRLHVSACTPRQGREKGMVAGSIVPPGWEDTTCPLCPRIQGEERTHTTWRRGKTTDMRAAHIVQRHTAHLSGQEEEHLTCLETLLACLTKNSLKNWAGIYIIMSLLLLALSASIQ